MDEEKGKKKTYSHTDGPQKATVQLETDNLFTNNVEKFTTQIREEIYYS